MKNQQAVGPELRPYQRALVEGIREAFTKTSRVLAVLPTGGGKTLVAAHIMRAALEKGRRVLAVAHRRELVGQLRAGLAQALGLSPEEVPAYLPGEKVPEGAPFAVGSIQTLARRGAGRWDMVVVDEAHHLPADTYQDIVRGGRWVLGFTATPVRADGRGLGEHFGALVQGPTISELIALGYLVPPRYLVPEEGGWDTSRLPVRGGDYAPREVEALAREVRLEVKVVEAYLEHLKGRPTVIFAAGVEHGRELAVRLRKAGVRAAFLDGETPLQERQEALGAFKRGDLEVLVNVALFTEGYDEPRISGILLARPTKSLGLYLQMIGRALRPFPGKADTLVVDATGVNYRAFGPVEAYTRWTLTKDEVSPEAVRASSSSSAPRRAGVRVVEGTGRLKEVSPEELGERKAFYLGLLWYARQRGFRDGWAYYRYLERFGEKPLWAWREEEPAFHEEAYVWARAGGSRPREAPLLLEAE